MQENEKFLNRRALGTEMERTAACFLRSRGYVLLDGHFTTRHGEIDLIYRNDHQIIFGEVKYRRSTAHGFPAEAVDREKQRRIIYSAMIYLQQHHLQQLDVRFDVIELLRQNGRLFIRVLENAFRP